jgi:undecaprenyl-diphosphatase
MALIAVRPTELDVAVANAVAAHTRSYAEEAARVITWGSDEHIVCALAAGWWLLARNKTPRARLASDHILVTTLIESALPHLLKKVFDKWRTFISQGRVYERFGHNRHFGVEVSISDTAFPAKPVMNSTFNPWVCYARRPQPAFHSSRPASLRR